MLLTGAPIKQNIKVELRAYIDESKSHGKQTPHLAIVMVGDNPRSRIYINQKITFAHSIGAHATVHSFPETISAKDLCAEVDRLGKDVTIHGIIVQMPLPAHFSAEDARLVIDTVPVEKDADGLTTLNTGRIMAGMKKAILPATTRGIFELCRYYNILIEGKHIVMIGRSNLVGKPTAMSMLAQGATVTICHSKTIDLQHIVKSADIVVSATGIPHLIGVDMVHAHQYLIDVGITIDGAGHIHGDIDTQVVEEHVAGVSPVPGGVGPLTVSGLFLNLIDLHRTQSE